MKFLNNLFTRNSDGRAGDISREALHKAECAAIERDLDQRLAIRKQTRITRNSPQYRAADTRRAGQ